MKTLHATIATLALLSLAGCGYVTSGKLDEQVAEVQAATAKLCKFIPTAASVGAILSANNPAVIGVAATATAICNAVTSAHAQSLTGDEKPCPEVNGVCVEGEFIDKDKGQ